MSMSPASSSRDWSDLPRSGFSVVRGFLDAEDIAALTQDFHSTALSDNRNYSLKTVGLKAFARIKPKLDRIAAEVRAGTDISVDLFQGATYFANELTSLEWHQEFEPFYLCQDLYNYLNFYLPFVKEDPRRSNVTLVPFDTLLARDPRASALVLRRGAQSFVRRDGQTILSNSTDGRKHVLDLDLESVATAPPLDAGDLLVVRGDVVHRTQDTETRRIAASFRMARGASVVTRAQLAEGGLHKLRVLLKSRRTFECAFEHFSELGRDESTVAQLSKHLRARLPKYQVSAKGLARMLAAMAPRFHLRSLVTGT